MKFGTITPRFILLRLLRMFVAMYVVLFLIQRFLVFPAYMANITLGKLKAPEAYGLKGFSELQLTTADQVHLTAWSHDPAEGKPIVLYFHGNAMHLAARVSRFNAFAHEGYGVFALSYRGYGTSEGSPSEHGLYADARAAIAWTNGHYAHPCIILYGESLGTGVAAEMAKEYNVYGLVLQSAYTSIADVAAETYWFLPGTHALVRDQFNTLSKLHGIHCPVLILHGDQDDQIPFEHGQKLAAAANAPKRFVPVHGAGHVNIPDAVILRAMGEFFGNLGKATGDNSKYTGTSQGSALAPIFCFAKSCPCAS